jgi:pyruvate dehydrogenase E1 component alpha subunit
MAELFGKVTGYSGGRGGSQHISCFEIGFLGSNGITGGGMPVGTGAALALKLQKKDGVVVVLLGDGAANQGSFHESLNLGALWKLPVVYVCENNLYAMFTHISESTSVSDIACRATAYGMPGEIVDGNSVLEVMEAVGRAIDRARGGQGPTLLECKTYRQLGHSKSDKREYRTRTEEKEWQERDPIARFRRYVIETQGLTEDGLRQLEESVRKEIDDAIAFAKESPLPSTDGLEASVFA